jgi:arginine decarboxylase
MGYISLAQQATAEQLFPLMPIHRLDEEPTELGHFADLTCDSDGKLARFIGDGQAKPLLELHALMPSEPNLIEIFLGGAYQLDHVVRGNTNAQVLEAMEHDPELLLERLRVASEAGIQRGQLKISEARRLMDHLETSLRQTTYLQE